MNALAPYGPSAPVTDGAARKAAGAYYTPASVVDYVVRHAIAPLCQERPPAPLSIVDPACGGGSFLIGALRVLTAWYGARAPAPSEIARRHLYGVDRDVRAVHAARAAIPGANIIQGDSLIGPDENGFDFRVAFPSVTEFDAVIGNPPFVRVRALRQNQPEWVEYFKRRYRTAVGSWDLYPLFVERALELVRHGGRIGFVLPIQALHQPNGERLRELLLDETALEVVADLSRLRVFRGAAVKTCVLVCARGAASPGAAIATLTPRLPEDLDGARHRAWPQRAVRGNPRSSLKLDLLSDKVRLCRRLRARSVALGELCYVTFGLRSCAKGRGRGGKERLITSDGDAPAAVPYLEGRDIERFRARPSGRFLRYLPSEMYSPRTPALFAGPKIVSRALLSRRAPVAALDESGAYAEQTLVCIVPHGVVTPPRAPVPSLRFLLGAINSRVQRFYFAAWIIDPSLGGGLIHAAPGAQGQLLVPRAGGRDQAEIAAAVDDAMCDGADPATERRIDQLLYRILGLTDGEIAAIEVDAC